MPGNNFSVRVASEGRGHFEAAVRLAFSGNAPGKKATHYLNGLPARKCRECFGKGSNSIHLFGQDSVEWKDRKNVDIPCRVCNGKPDLLPASAMILYWTEPGKHVGAERLPFPITVDGAVNFLWDWLQDVEYEKQPDHDGDNHKGFIVTTGDFWGHCEGAWESILMVTPYWQMYGK